jgi:hypothetical protein
MVGWVSPPLGIGFEFCLGNLELYRLNEQKFLTYLELERQRKQERLEKGKNKDEEY